MSETTITPSTLVQKARELGREAATAPLTELIVKLVSPFRDNKATLVRLRNEFLIGYISSKLGANSEDRAIDILAKKQLTKANKGQKNVRTDKEQRIEKAGRNLWAHGLAAAGIGVVKDGRTKKKAGLSSKSTLTTPEDNLGNLPIPTFKSAEDANTYLDTMSDHMDVCLEHNAKVLVDRI
jgi:hypothetical protein